MMNRRGFLKLGGKAAVAGATYAVLGGTMTRIAPDEVEGALADGKVTLTSMDEDGKGPVLMRVVMDQRAGLQWVAAPENELVRVQAIYVIPVAEGLQELHVIGTPREPLPT